MKLLGRLALVLLLALLPPVGCGARQWAGDCPPVQRLMPVQVVRSRQPAQALRTVRAVGPAAR